ncbi:MAG: TrbI/VirB10 family protein [Bradyrhizobium sp.]
MIGIYDSQVATGQSRVLLNLTRSIKPKSHLIMLERQPCADAGDYSGLSDEVDNHRTQLSGCSVAFEITVGRQRSECWR